MDTYMDDPTWENEIGKEIIEKVKKKLQWWKVKMFLQLEGLLGANPFSRTC